MQHDDAVVHAFLVPWQQNLQTSINVAVKARQAVRLSRLELDAAKQTYVIREMYITHPPLYAPLCIHVLTWYSRFSRLKNAGPTKQEHARLEVENAEDDLVQKTEVAITLMKAVLDNVRDDLCHEFVSFFC